MGTGFLSKLKSAVNGKGSILCVSIDPALPGQRGTETIPADIGRVKFIENIIAAVKDHCSSIKINRQFILGLTTSELVDINTLASRNGLISICDHKLSDIGSSNDSCLYWVEKEGFDALTVSPFPGNIESTAKSCGKYGLGSIVLTLMSNPDSIWVKRAALNDAPVYEFFARQVRDFADGCVVGATGHVTPEEIRAIRAIIGERKLIFSPGVGAQGGSVEKVLEAAGSNTLITVGRDVIYAGDPRKRAEEYNALFNQVREKVGHHGFQ